MLTQDGGEVTDSGRDFFERLGIDLADKGKRPFCRACLDWSERQSHLGGLLGRLLLARFQVLDWLRRPAEGRALTVTPKGRAGFARSFPDLPLLAGLGA